MGLQLSYRHAAGGHVLFSYSSKWQSSGGCTHAKRLHSGGPKGGDGVHAPCGIVAVCRSTITMSLSIPCCLFTHAHPHPLPFCAGLHPPPSGCWPRFKAAVKQLKRDVLALYYAVHDPRTPLLSKILPWLVLAYALSPLDLIPDFIPVLGFLDDMLLLPVGLWLSVKLIPKEVGFVDGDPRCRTDHMVYKLMLCLTYAGVAAYHRSSCCCRWQDECSSS